MRLVGASSLYIQLPFLLESLVAALVGVGLAAGALIGFMCVVDLRDAAADLEHRGVGRLGRRALAIGRHRAHRPRADVDPDTRDDPEIPESLTSDRVTVDLPLASPTAPRQPGGSFLPPYTVRRPCRPRRA